MDEVKHYPKKGHKPKEGHPWHKTNFKISQWAKDKSEQSKPNNFRVGQLKGLKEKKRHY